MNRVSGSKIDLLLQCTGAFGLEWDTSTNPAASYGTEAHKYLETGEDELGIYQHIPRLCDWPGDLLREVQLWMRPEDGDWLFGEMEFGHILAADIVPDTDGRPKLPEGAIGMRADVACFDLAAPMIGDLKTGQKTLGPERLSQLILGAYMLDGILGGQPGYITGIVIHAPRPKDGQVPRAKIRPCAYGAGFAGGLITMLRKAMADVTTSPETNPGKECMFCPARQSCDNPGRKKYQLKVVAK